MSLTCRYISGLGRARRWTFSAVSGASGIVGQIAVQSAPLLGAGRVVAAARSEESLKRARRELGADAAVRIDEDGDLGDRFRGAAGGDVDLVIDPVWGPAAVAALEALGEGGRLVQIGNSAGAETEVPARAIRTRIRSIIGHTNFAAPHAVKEGAFQSMCHHAAGGSRYGRGSPTRSGRRGLGRQADGPHRKLVIRPE